MNKIILDTQAGGYRCWWCSHLFGPSEAQVRLTWDQALNLWLEMNRVMPLNKP